MSILMSSLDSKDSSLLLEAADSAPILAPTPNGKLYLLYAKGSDRQTDLMAQQLDPASAALIGEPVTLVPSIGMVANPVVRPTVGVSASGLLAYQSGHGASDGTLTWLDRAGKPLGTAGKPGSFNRPALSPDGIQLATIQNSDLSVTDLTRGTTTRLTFDRSALGPVWSPDGKQVAVNRNGKGVVVNLDGSGERALPEKNGGVVGWFPGGFIHTDGNILTLFAGDAPGVQIGLPSSARPVVSPDGKYVAYDSIASGRRQVYVEPLPPGSGRVQISVEGGTAPRWRRDGKELFFITPGKMMAVDVTLQPKVSAAIPHPLFDLPPGGWNGDVHPSGQRFIHLMRSGEAELDNPITVVQNWWVDLEKK
jgi:hypothetical protein